MTSKFFEEQFEIYHNSFVNQPLDEAIEEINGAMEYSIEYDKEKGKPYMRYLIGFGGPNVSINVYNDDITFSFGWWHHREVSLKGTQNYDDLWYRYGTKAKEDILYLMDTLELKI